MNSGILALWNDCADGFETEYEDWYQGEHLPERLAIPGFMRGRRFQSIAGDPTYFTYYETTSAQILNSEDYIQRLNNPSEMTRHVMANVFTNMNRTICERSRVEGRYRGGYALTFRFEATAPSQQIVDEVFAELGPQRSVARVEWWQAAGGGKSLSTEEKIRGGDRSITACLLVEALRERDVTALQQQVSRHLDANASRAGVYQLLCDVQCDA